jgi:Zn-dependent protease with chaperone function
MRSRLEDLCEREGMRCRDLLVWHTHRHVHNAAVVGFLPSLRYILISDAMALHFSAEEIEAVFAHEIAHVNLHHMRYYGLFAISFLPFYAALLDGLAALDLVRPLTSLTLIQLDVWQALVLLVFAGLYWSIGFGFLSRRFEREADYRAVGTTDPQAFMTALEKLARLGGRPRGSTSWRHFSIEDRLAFIRQVRDAPERAARVAGVARWLRALLCMAAGAAVLRVVLWRPELIGL